MLIIVYIPFWEQQDELQLFFSSLQKICSQFPQHTISVIYDGCTVPIHHPTDIPFAEHPKFEGLICALREAHYKAKRYCIIRQGVLPTMSEWSAILDQQADACFVQDGCADDGLLVMNQEAYSELLSVETRLCSLGYGMAAHARWYQKQKTCSTIEIQSYALQKPTQHRIHITSNVLCSWLTHGNYTILSEFTPPSWYQPTRETITIIIPIWNNLPLTQRCVASIFKSTLYPFTLVLVDNASTEPVGEWAENLCQQHPHVHYIRNEVNEGFPYGCNIGMQYAHNSHVVLLNNDTIVTPYWLSILVAGLNNPTVGLVSGMSCHIGLTEQDIRPVPYLTHKELFSFAWHTNRHQHGEFTHTTLIVFLFVLIHKDLISRIGGLDPIFSFGNCEDSDYCFRANRAGYQSMIMHDVFIDHVGSASFRNQSFSYSQLIAQNTTYARSKNIPSPKEHLFLHTPVDERWALQRPFDEQWDVIPLTMKECMGKVIPLYSPFSPETAILAFPNVSYPWAEELDSLLKTHWNIILRIDPPTESFQEEVAHRISTLSPAEQSRIFLETTRLPTTQRASIYALATHYAPLKRFDAFMFARELNALAIPLTKYEQKS